MHIDISFLNYLLLWFIFDKTISKTCFFIFSITNRTQLLIENRFHCKSLVSALKFENIIAENNSHSCIYKALLPPHKEIDWPCVRGNKNGRSWLISVWSRFECSEYWALLEEKKKSIPFDNGRVYFGLTSSSSFSSSFSSSDSSFVRCLFGQLRPWIKIVSSSIAVRKAAGKGWKRKGHFSKGHIRVFLRIGWMTGRRYS